jgi:hypothetical protein
VEVFQVSAEDLNKTQALAEMEITTSRPEAAKPWPFSWPASQDMAKLDL